MKWLKLLGATVVFMCAFAGPALAGQGFDVTFNGSNGFPSTVIGNITYKQWYENDIVAGSRVDPGWKTVYTEHCASFFGCGKKEQGNDSLAADGILWSLMDGSSSAVSFCISDRKPISTLCGVHDSGGSQLIYKHWIAGCVAKSGYTCVVSAMYKSGSRIAIRYTLGLTSSIMKK